MQLQKNDWHEGIMEEANVRGVVDKFSRNAWEFYESF